MNPRVQCISKSSFQKPLATPPFSAWGGHAPFAFWLIENHRPACLVELGTFLGFSYFCFCQQIRTMGLQARCTAIDTWTGDEHGGFYDDNVFDRLKKYNDSEYG